MIQSKLVYALVILLGTVTAMQINTEEDATQPILKDTRNNVTDQEYNAVLQAIKQAETMYTATDYEKIARYIGLSTRVDSSALRWNVHVHEGRIRQVGFATNAKATREFLVLLNPGKYGLSYTLIGCLNIYCTNSNFYGGGSNPSNFSNATSDAYKEYIVASIDDAMTRKGNDIMGNADIIVSDMFKNAPMGLWTVVIADPSARFGYFVCLNILGQIWFSLRAYGGLKWNYFGYMHPG